MTGWSGTGGPGAAGGPTVTPLPTVMALLAFGHDRNSCRVGES